MKKISFVSKSIGLNNFLLDPNNYRFIDNPIYKKKIFKKYHLPEVQNATLRLIEQNKQYQLAELKRSILINGYVPMERIIVIPYEHKRGCYLIVEGNRRIAALKSLLQEQKEGVIDLTDFQIKQFSTIPAAILNAPKDQISKAQRVIMGIRHVAGPKQWGAYQQAQLIVELFEAEAQDFQSIAAHLCLTPSEVSRRYRAMKALGTMEADELYADRSDFEQYLLFNELVSSTVIREYFTWDDRNFRFTDINKAREFYELIAPEGGQEAKLKIYSDVRKLKQILPHAKARATLMDPEKTLTDALEIAELLDDEARQESLTIKDAMSEINHSLSKIDVLSLRLAPDERLLIDSVIARLQQLKEIGQQQRQG